jgi:hypothetical protein
LCAATDQGSEYGSDQPSAAEFIVVTATEGTEFFTGLANFQILKSFKSS